MASTQQSHDVSHRCGRIGIGTHLQVQVAQPESVGNPMAVRLERDERLMILVLTREVHAKGLQDADDLVGLSAKPDCITWAHALWVQLSACGMAKDDHSLTVVFLSQEPSSRGVEAAHSRVVCARPQETNARRIVAEPECRVSHHNRNDRFERRDLIANGRHIIGLQ